MNETSETTESHDDAAVGTALPAPPPPPPLPVAEPPPSPSQSVRESSSGGHATFYGLILNALIIGAALVYAGMQIRQGFEQRQVIQVQAPAPAPNGAPAPNNAGPAFDQSKFNGVTDSDYVYGEKSATTSLIVYLDFECPFCQGYYPVAKQVVDDSGGKLNMVVRLFPLSFHPHAAYLANAALCVADQQGAPAFYAFAEKVFSSTIADDNTPLVNAVATNLKLDQPKLMQCIADNPHAAALKTDVAEASALGVTGTPASVLYDHRNGKTQFFVGGENLAQVQARVAAF